ncbi:MAG TPA: chemotaxis protein CheB [Comamonadaceae bacterium]|uniref:chemotaxis protein CheB n=1 Tax=Pulveribacter sp. TaxID=2678893 RepID=UPI000EDE6D31|nr:chemotaxis protein CheB [Pulveribacter sp.]HCL87180.1 chemotaxis protein CheB [Comamonadaceae bacterium]
MTAAAAVPRAIVIGGSAGSLDALGLLLPALARQLDAAVVVALHLPREQPSLLCDIFRHRCPLDVREAQDKEPLAPATIFFAPPDYHLLVDAGPSLALSIDPPLHFSRPSIDVLFESAADVYGPALTALLLSGANADGARGLALVQRLGGTTLVQSPASASAAAMPEAALALLEPDYVLAPADMAPLLNQLHQGRIA